MASTRWSARSRARHFLQSMRGSEKLLRWPEASHTLVFSKIPESSPTTSSRRVHEVLPPQVFEVLLELDAVGAVVPRVGETAVDLGAGEDETPALGEGDDVLEVCKLCHFLSVATAGLRDRAFLM